MSLGFHVSRNDGETKMGIREALEKSIELLKGYGISSPAAQIFISGPKNYKEILSHDDKKDIEKLVRSAGLQLVIHGAFVDYPWKGSPSSINNIKKELITSDAIGSTGVIVHLGGRANEGRVLTHVLTKISSNYESRLWLEIHAAKPSSGTYETPKKISRLFENARSIIEAKKLNVKLGLCIDTAHLFSCGVSLSSRSAARDWLAKLPPVPVMLHLNDSASELGSGTDRHEALCKGNIWGMYHPDTGQLPIEESGLVYILSWAEENNITVILERKYKDIQMDLSLITKLGFFKPN